MPGGKSMNITHLDKKSTQADEINNIKSGIMQPYFFPYIGYWQLINAVDYFVLLDDVNYITRGYINRNNILVNGNAHRFTIPVKQASQNKLIKDTQFYFSKKDKNKFLLMLSNAYKKAPQFIDVMPLLERIINYQQEDITSYIHNALKVVMEYLHINTQIYISSKIEKNEDLHGERKIIEICKKLSASVYINPTGGRKLYNRLNFEREGIDLYFLDTRIDSIIYNQNQESFVKNLSLIDVLFFNDVEKIKNFLQEFDLHKE